VNNCIVLDGRKLAAISNEELSKKASDLLTNHGRKPCLAAILVGQDPASATYVSMKEKACNTIGIETRTYKKDVECSTREVLELIDLLNNDEQVDGILLQHPVPNHVDELMCFNAINIEKDVDGVTTLGFGNLSMGIDSFGSCTPLGIMRLLNHYGITIEGKTALVIGRSQILGKPMAAMLLNANATVTVAHSKTKNLNELLAQSDIVVAAVGKPQFIDSSKLKLGSVLIDAGYHPDENCGDVDLSNVEQVVSAYTPVPGGVGPMTINTLIYNTIHSMEKRVNVK